MMTIAKGRAWGEAGSLDEHGVVVRSDAEAAAVLAEARSQGRPLPTLGLLGGDLCATMGGSGSHAHLRGEQARRYPIDLGLARLDGIEVPFLAHVIVRRRTWLGRVVAIMNAQWYGAWDLGPKSHPNDGLLDISDAEMSLGQRFAARRRLPTGTHLPHPDIKVRRTRAWQTEFTPALPVLIDGIALGKVARLEVEVVPDAVTVVI